MGRGKRGSGGEDANEDVSAVSGGADERNKPGASVVAAPAKKERVAPAVDGDLAYQNELLPLEEIYVAAGIVSPRRGYTIKKVMEMLEVNTSARCRRDAPRVSDDGADAAGISVAEALAR